jgi:predicted nucleotidyltransferase component of viral defense system
VTPSYPVSFVDIREWADVTGVSVTEARVRFAQYAVLHAIAAVRPLREGLVFKGGNALDFVLMPNRSTVDLDFSVDHTSLLAMPDAEAIRTLLERGVPVANANLGVMLQVQRFRASPPGEDRHFVTFRGRVGYALPDQSRVRQRMVQGEVIPQNIALDISINEPIGGTQLVAIGPQLHLRVATLEDIIAEKLRALLQQPIRNRQRRQDLLDIAVILRQEIDFDRRLVADYLVAKAAARDVTVSTLAFRDPEVARRAGEDYAELEETTRVLFVPLEDALALLFGLVEHLDIPRE